MEPIMKNLFIVLAIVACAIVLGAWFADNRSIRNTDNIDTAAPEGGRTQHQIGGEPANQQ